MTDNETLTELAERWRKSAEWAADNGYERMAEAYDECADELEGVL